MDQNEQYESGIYGMAEARFGGKIRIDVVEFSGTHKHGIALSEFYQKGTVGKPSPTQQHHDPQVYLIFDDMNSVKALEHALMTVREKLKRDAELNSERQDNPILSKKITDCDLSVRTLNICKSNGLDTLGDIVRMSKTDWLRLRNGGKRSLSELNDYLASLGLSWNEQQPATT